MPRKALRCALMVDISGFGRSEWDDAIRYHQVVVLRRLLRHVLQSTWLVPWHMKSTGDGMLYLFNVRDQGVVVNAVARLAEQLGEHNQQVEPLFRLQLRAAVDFGGITLKWRIEVGGMINRVARMLDSAELHEHLRAGQDDLVFMLDEGIYQDVVKSGRCWYRPGDFMLVEFSPEDVSTGAPERARLLLLGATPTQAPPPPRPLGAIVIGWLRVPTAVVQDAALELVGLIHRYARQLRAAALVLVPLALVAALVSSFLSPIRVLLSGCPVPTQLVVLAAPGIVEQVEDLADDFADDHVAWWTGCRLVNIRVFTAPSHGEVARFAADGWPPDSEAVTRLGPEPDVWIAASAGVTRTVEDELPAGRFERLEPVATSPLVLAAEPALKRELGLEATTVVTWDEIRAWQETASAGRIRLVRANPTASAAALLATGALYDAGGTTPKARRDLEATIRPAGVDEPTELCDMGLPPATGPPVPQALFTSEQRLLARNLGHLATGCGPLQVKERLQAVYPHDEAGRTPFLEYSYTLLPAAFEHPEGRREDLAQAFHDHLLAPEAQERLADAGFRSRDYELSGAYGATEGVDPTQPDAPAGPPGLGAVTRTVARWQMARPAARLILGMDVSGSMGEPYAGGTRLGVAREAAAELVRQLTAEDYVGLWAFAENLPPDNTSEYRSLIDLDRVDAQAAGLSQRDRVLRALDELAWENRGTRLYEVLMAGLDELRQTGGPDEVRGLLVVTDGISEARPDAGPDQVLARLDENVFLFLLVVGSAGCDLGGPATLDRHPNALCVDADTTGLPAAFAQISTMLLGSGGV